MTLYVDSGNDMSHLAPGYERSLSVHIANMERHLGILLRLEGCIHRLFASGQSSQPSAAPPISNVKSECTLLNENMYILGWISHRILKETHPMRNNCSTSPVGSSQKAVAPGVF
jgi:hypothetical protein